MEPVEPEATELLPLEECHREAIGIGGIEKLVNQAPADLCCSVDGRLLINPVRSPNGAVFEYSVLVIALYQGGGICPCTGEVLSLESCQYDEEVKRNSTAYIKRWARGVCT